MHVCVGCLAEVLVLSLCWLLGKVLGIYFVCGALRQGLPFFLGAVIGAGVFSVLCPVRNFLMGAVFFSVCCDVFFCGRD